MYFLFGASVRTLCQPARTSDFFVASMCFGVHCFPLKICVPSTSPFPPSLVVSLHADWPSLRPTFVPPLRFAFTGLDSPSHCPPPPPRDNVASIHRNIRSEQSVVVKLCLAWLARLISLSVPVYTCSVRSGQHRGVLFSSVFVRFLPRTHHLSPSLSSFDCSVSNAERAAPMFSRTPCSGSGETTRASPFTG
jgi:hypothetical protein